MNIVNLSGNSLANIKQNKNGTNYTACNLTPPPPTNNNQDKLKTKNKGLIRGNIAYNLALLPATIASFGIIGAMRKVSNLNTQDSTILTRAVKSGLEKSGLTQKGVEVLTMEEQGLKDYFNIEYTANDNKALLALETENKNNPVVKFLSKYNKEAGDAAANTMTKMHASNFKLGLNACYMPNTNKIITPNKHLQTSAFHEIGHALNNNGGGFLKLLQQTRPLAKLIPMAVLLISLLNKHNAAEQTNENDTKVQKSFNFIKKNAEKIAFISMIPMIMEEGIASLRGGKLAKNLVKNGKLSKNLLNKIKLTNIGGFSSYIVAAIGTAFAIKTAINVKDKAQIKYEKRQAEKAFQ